MYNIRSLDAIKDYLLSRGETLAVAESVTAGHLQAACSLVTDATKFFQGGITAYNLGQKARHLRIDPIRAEACNCVSQTTADEMAIHALALFSSDWAIGITGYAAPVPEMGINDLFAFYAIASHGKLAWHGKLEAPDSGLYDVQVYFTEHVIAEFHLRLQEMA